jgi:hypothetical protein
MDDAAALAECERGEDSAKTAYKDALQEDLPDFVRETVQNQHYSILAAHDRIKALRDEETTMKSSSLDNRKATGEAEGKKLAVRGLFQSPIAPSQPRRWSRCRDSPHLCEYKQQNVEV